MDNNYVTINKDNKSIANVVYFDDGTIEINKKTKKINTDNRNVIDCWF